MSWSFSTAGTKASVMEDVAKAFIPGSVKGYALDALGQFPEDTLLYASGYGHLFTGGDYSTTSANLEVRPLTDEEKEKAGYKMKWVK